MLTGREQVLIIRLNLARVKSIENVSYTNLLSMWTSIQPDLLRMFMNDRRTAVSCPSEAFWEQPLLSRTLRTFRGTQTLTYHHP